MPVPNGYVRLRRGLLRRGLLRRGLLRHGLLPRGLLRLSLPLELDLRAQFDHSVGRDPEVLRGRS